MSTKFILYSFYFLIVAALTFMVYQLFTKKNDCENAALSYYQTFLPNQNSPEAKAAEASMQKTCKAMGVEAEVYLKSMGLQK